MTRFRALHGRHSRQMLADAAARLIAEHGIQDYTLAKRKAARQLGLPEGQDMPSNEEIEAALAERQALYEPEELATVLAELRQEAMEVMEVFARFQPALTGPVATGIVSEHSLIELEISAESSKEFEQFLVNQSIEFKIQDRPGRMGYLIFAEPTDVLIRLIPPELRHAPGAPRLRMSRQQLAHALATAGELA
ncbi:MAG: hypothetical protein HZB71_09470 [Betaproteobacteria bacterium]|nr:hypothetical protein [Betaproteobacteria bacterium]